MTIEHRDPADEPDIENRESDPPADVPADAAPGDHPETSNLDDLIINDGPDDGWEAAEWEASTQGAGNESGYVAEWDLWAADDDEPTADTSTVMGSLGGTIASVVLHVWLLFLLAGLVVPESRYLPTEPIDSRMETVKEEEKPEEDEIEYELVNPQDREIPVREVLNAASVGQSQTNDPVLESRPEPLTDILVDRQRRRMYDVPQGMKLDDRLVVKGTIGDNIVQMESALDRVTWEIANHLKERKVLVVWLLDASGSLQKQREVIVNRLDRIYGELGALENVGQIPRRQQGLLSAVVSYGAETSYLCDPTDKFEDVKTAIADLQADPSGRENVFTAVTQVVKLWSKYRAEQGRRIMLVTVTDESGDDFDMHELALARCRRYGVQAYVIGPAAVFGRRKGYVPYVAPENGQTYRLPVDLGPETAMYENVDLPFWFAGPQYTYLSAGFGPYALSRLVRETGGIYFTTNMTTMEGLSPIGVFDSEALKPFAPDYTFGTRAEYEQDLMQHPLRRAVVMGARLSRQNPPEGTPALELRVTPANFRQVATDSQRTVAKTTLMVENILAAFPPGIETQLDEESSPRWRMAFCLNYGRLLALKVRAYEYNAACASLKSDLSPQDVGIRANQWIFRPKPELNYATNMKRLAQTAEALLRRCVDEAPGTPWAVLAARELRNPLGLDVDMRFIPPPTPRPRADSNAPRKKRVRLAPDPRPKKAATPPPKPVQPKLPLL